VFTYRGEKKKRVLHFVQDDNRCFVRGSGYLYFTGWKVRVQRVSSKKWMNSWKVDLASSDKGFSSMPESGISMDQ